MYRLSAVLLLLAMASTSCTSHHRYSGHPSPTVAPSSQAPTPWARQGKVIFVDPGHGGHDSGTMSLKEPKTLEKHLVLTTSRMVRDYLKKMGYQVVMSRADDRFIELRDRVSLAHKAGADLFVSVHYNSAPSTDAHGIEVFYYQPKEETTRTVSSKDLAGKVLARSLRYTQAKSRGVKHGDFAVIRETQIPAVLIEGGFLTNDMELAKLRDPAYLAQIAKGVAVGVDEYIQEKSRQ